MARLAFFTERLPPADRARSSSEITDFSYDLMTSLADQQHEVRVFSTYREDDTLPASHPRLQILRPFRRWSWLEVPRLIPILLDFQPEILHFIQPRAEAFSGLTNAMTALPSLAPLIGRPRIVVSLYDVRKSELHKNRNLLSFCDTVIVANRQQAAEVARWLSETAKSEAVIPKIEIVALPTVDPVQLTTEREVMNGLEALQETSKKLILIPGELDEQRDLDQLAILLNELMSAISDLGVIFGGGWGHVTLNQRRNFIRMFEDRGHGSRFLLTGPLSPSAEQTCLEASTVVLLAGLPDSSLPLARWIRLTLQASRPLILSEEQCRLDPLRFQHRENSFIVPDDPRQWGISISESVVDDKLRREIRSRLPEFARTEAVDQPGNAMSRIYAQVLRLSPKPLR